MSFLTINGRTVRGTDFRYEICWYGTWYGVSVRILIGTVRGTDFGTDPNLVRYVVRIFFRYGTWYGKKSEKLIKLFLIFSHKKSVPVRILVPNSVQSTVPQSVPVKVSYQIKSRTKNPYHVPFHTDGKAFLVLDHPRSS